MSINKYYSKIMDHYEANETMFMYFEFGRIFRMLADIEPVVLEDAPNPLETLGFDYNNDTTGFKGPTVWSSH